MTAYTKLTHAYNQRRVGSSWKAMDNYGFAALKLTPSGEFLLYARLYDYNTPKRKVSGVAPVARVSQDNVVTLLPGITYWCLYSFMNKFGHFLGMRTDYSRYSRSVKYRTRFKIYGNADSTLPFRPFVSWNVSTGEVLWRPADDTKYVALRNRAREMNAIVRAASRVTLTVAELQGLAEFGKARIEDVNTAASTGKKLHPYNRLRLYFDARQHDAIRDSDMEAYYNAKLDEALIDVGWWVTNTIRVVERVTAAMERARIHTLHQTRLAHDGYRLEAMP
jgi:hypothetical protein